MARSIHARFTSKPDHYANGAFDGVDGASQGIEVP